jgi:hypothetical protein
VLGATDVIVVCAFAAHQKDADDPTHERNLRRDDVMPTQLLQLPQLPAKADKIVVHIRPASSTSRSSSSLHSGPCSHLLLLLLLLPLLSLFLHRIIIIIIIFVITHGHHFRDRPPSLFFESISSPAVTAFSFVHPTAVSLCQPCPSLPPPMLGHRAPVPPSAGDVGGPFSPRNTIGHRVFDVSPGFVTGDDLDDDGDDDDCPILPPVSPEMLGTLSTPMAVRRSAAVSSQSLRTPTHAPVTSSPGAKGTPTALSPLVLAHGKRGGKDRDHHL